MKKLFSEQIFDIVETSDGFMIVYRRPEFEDKTVVSYKSVSIEDGVVTQRTRADYEFVKYGDKSKVPQFENGNFITCSCVKLDDDRVFVVAPDGEAMILDADNNVEWQGSIKYKEQGPTAIVNFGHTLWASFSDKNALIRFNLRTMREELRIGGSNDSSFSGPEGMWVDPQNEKLFVCNNKAQNILEVNMRTYTVVEYAVFDEPVHKYLRIGNKELAVLDSGLFLL